VVNTPSGMGSSYLMMSIGMVVEPFLAVITMRERRDTVSDWMRSF
jgi:hypothetical protein